MAICLPFRLISILFVVQAVMPQHIWTVPFLVTLGELGWVLILPETLMYPDNQEHKFI